MKKGYKLFVPAIIVLVFALYYIIYTVLPANQSAKKVTKKFPCNRIISLAPSTTEILFTLGLGDRIVGVSQFCNWPPEAKNLPRMGGLMNPNYEAIIAAKPDIVIIFDDMLDIQNKLKTLGVETLTVRHNTINDILESMLLIGEYCNCAEQAKSTVNKIQQRIRNIRDQNQQHYKPKILLCVGHNYSQNPSAKLENIYIAGEDGFYSEIIKLAGGQNAYTGRLSFPMVSYESILAMNPQIIVDIIPPTNTDFDSEIIKRQWKNIGNTEAGKYENIYICSEDFMSIPGPRFVNIIEKIASFVGSYRQKVENE